MRRIEHPGLAAVITLAAAAASSAVAVPDCDDRIDIANPARFPFNTICTLRYDADFDGVLGAVGSGALISPHAVLTCGHCVYKRNEGDWNRADIHIQPGAFRDGADIVHPYGSRIGDIKATNTKWQDLTFTPPADVDYGCLKIICPFEELTTFMCVRFDYAPSFVNMSGYPVEDLPDPADTYDQWRGADDVTDTFDRRLIYEQRSTGGASGSPVWLYDSSTGERSIVAVNRGHSTECNGIGTRLVWQNETAIRDWMTWEPTFAQKIEAGCAFTAEPIPWDLLQQHILQFPQQIVSADTARLINPIVPPPAPPTARLMQVIEGTFYEWEEFRTEPENPASPRFLRMISPEPQWLSVSEARVLITASARLVDEVPFGPNLTLGPVTPAEAIFEPQQDPGTNSIDLVADAIVQFAAPNGPFCPADVDGDGVVGFPDLLAVLASWGDCPSGTACPSDIDGSGATGFEDVIAVLAAFGPCVP